MTLTAKLARRILVPVISLSALVGAGYEYAVSKSAEKEAEHGLISTGHAASEMLQARISDHQVLLGALLLNERLKTYDESRLSGDRARALETRQALEAMCISILQCTEGVHAIDLVDDKGFTLLAVAGDQAHAPRGNVRKSAWFPIAQAGEYGFAWEARGVGRLTRRVSLADGRKRYATMLVDFEALAAPAVSFIQRQQPSAVVFVRDVHGDVAFLKGRTGAEEDILRAETPAGRAGRLHIEVPRRVLLAGSTRSTTQFLSIAGFFAGLLLVSVWIAIRRTVLEPVSKTLAIARAEGPTSETDELGIIGRTLRDALSSSRLARQRVSELEAELAAQNAEIAAIGDAREEVIAASRDCLEDLHVLVVDADAARRAATCAKLEACLVRPAQASNETEAGARLREARTSGHRIQVVLVDADVADRGGAKFADTIRRSPAFADLPLCVITSDADEDLEGDVFEAVLMRPFDARRLGDALLCALLPRIDLAALPEPSPVLPTRRARGILVVDDYPAQRKSTARLLERLGHTVHVAADGMHACEMVEQGEFDLILMDCQMPVMDGYQATAEIRRRHDDKRETPIIGMTPVAGEDDHARCMSAGMDDSIHKPISTRELERVLANWAGKRRAA